MAALRFNGLRRSNAKAQQSRAPIATVLCCYVEHNFATKSCSIGDAMATAGGQRDGASAATTEGGAFAESRKPEG
jgi:hypothetical protein